MQPAATPPSSTSASTTFPSLAPLPPPPPTTTPTPPLASPTPSKRSTAKRGTAACRSLRVNGGRRVGWEERVCRVRREMRSRVRLGAGWEGRRGWCEEEEGTGSGGSDFPVPLPLLSLPPTLNYTTPNDACIDIYGSRATVAFEGGRRGGIGKASSRFASSSVPSC